MIRIIKCVERSKVFFIKLNIIPETNPNSPNKMKPISVASESNNKNAITDGTKMKR